ncbi:metal/formaldehyde-sensitive transcriptional repressor [Xanthomonas theicola]|uniref:Regulator n=1 Tax=Xanthomonas theicola TaxID=56464 RepID=A0A2S6ZJX4_9XANT|nr:metal/formaldehyde-sensitive transcriptional repressor [Xanthomonas theicola]PPT92496.1 regulator [Xanthomonas theicola]QNH26412.1 metal/formaldehyde-sensitive transcriptional repressor [Xanthomonas theicola]
MPHTSHEKKRVLARIHHRVHGQAEALERALEGGADCAAVPQQIAAIGGAVNGLMSEVMQAHLREEFGHAAGSDAQRAMRVRQMGTLVHSYLKRPEPRATQPVVPGETA